MSIFKSVRKGIKKVFKKIGGHIKKQFKRFGKFMDKAGILGQIAMMFIIPGVGGALMKGISGAFSKLVGSAATKAVVGTGVNATVTVGTDVAVKAGVKVGANKAAEVATTKVVEGSGMLGSKSAVIRGAGKVLEAAGNFVKVGAKAFSTVTEGISSFIGEFSKTALNKIPGVNIKSAAPTMGQAWKNVQNSVMQNASGTVQAFNTSIGIEPTAGSTKFGTEGFKVADRVSVDSIAASKNVTGKLTPDPIMDGGTVQTLTEGPTTGLRPAPKTGPQTQEITPDMTEEQIGRIDAYNNALEREAGRVKARQNVYGDSKFVKTSSAPAPDSLLSQKGNFKADEFLKSDYYKTNFSSDPLVGGGGIEYDFAGTKAYVDPTKLADVSNINTFAEFQTGQVGAATDKGFFEKIGQGIKDIPSNIKTSILEAPQKISDIPGQFVDNLKSSVTDLPSRALNAALNKPDAAQVTYSSVGLSDIPQSTYGMNQSNIAESGMAVAGYQSKVNPTTLYGNQSQAYDQFFKMMGPQAQQMRA